MRCRPSARRLLCCRCLTCPTATSTACSSSSAGSCSVVGERTRAITGARRRCRLCRSSMHRLLAWSSAASGVHSLTVLPFASACTAHARSAGALHDERRDSWLALRAVGVAPLASIAHGGEGEATSATARALAHSPSILPLPAPPRPRGAMLLSSGGMAADMVRTLERRPPSSLRSAPLPTWAGLIVRRAAAARVLGGLGCGRRPSGRRSHAV